MKPKSKYHYLKQQYSKQLKGFDKYLQKRGNQKDSIRATLNYTACFLSWLRAEGLSVKQVRYNDMLSFIEVFRNQNKSVRLMNHTLCSVRHYYAFLKHKDPNITCPATKLYIRGTKKKLPSNILEYKYLEEIYHNYTVIDHRSQRNKVILGLLIYQGLSTSELMQLQPHCLKLKEGKIIILGNPNRNQRILNLKSFQVLEILEYIKQNKSSKQLLISSRGNINIKPSLLHMFRALHKQYPEVLNPKQIRASVITHWLKKYNLRQVQYMAGHKYVSSTERYQLNNLDKLHSKIAKYHPLN